MKKQIEQLQLIFDVLDARGILDNVILIGSWCLFFYQKIFENFEGSIKTTDIDFFISNHRSKSFNHLIINDFKKINYDLMKDFLTNRTTLISQNGFEIEFVARVNRNKDACIKIGESGIYAEALNYVEIFANNFLIVNLFNHSIRIASPEAFILGKILVLNRRKNKIEKDIEAINNLLSFIYSSVQLSKKLNDLFSSLPKKWRKTIKSNSLLYGIEISFL